MKSESLALEWKECRDTIGRFDNYLLKLRLLGFSTFTLLFMAIVGISGVKQTNSTLTPEGLLFAIITLSLFVLAIYFLDRYYERMLLIAVYRASRLEAHRLKGFRIGLTTEIEFQKENISTTKLRSNFLKASHMVNIVYTFMLITMWIHYFVLSSKLETINKNFLYFAISAIILIIALSITAHTLLLEPESLIKLRSKVVKSPVVMSQYEIAYAIKRIAFRVHQWVKSEGTNEIVIVSIPSGARPFTEDLIRELECTGLSISLYILCLEATKKTELLPECTFGYGKIDANINGRLVLIVDDLLDSGRTLQKAIGLVVGNCPKSIKKAILINKYDEMGIMADYIGLNLGLDKAVLKEKGIKDYWLFGYGMDLDGQYRDIEYIGWIEKKYEV